MTETVRIIFEKNKVIQTYFNDSEWTRFDQKKDAVLKRRQEFFAGRICAALAYKKLTGNDLLELHSNEDRSPRWPAGIVGSLSHVDKYVVAELSMTASGLGVDLAVLGSVGRELLTSISHKDDVKHVTEINSEHLLTYIFSFKESLFKAVYPLVHEFFDFKEASVVNINFSKNTFQIVLDEKVSALITDKTYHKNGKFSVTGDFVLVDVDTILSRIIF